MPVLSIEILEALSSAGRLFWLAVVEGRHVLVICF